MLNYNFYNQIFKKIEDLTQKRYQQIKFLYCLFKNILSFDLFYTIRFLKTLEDENKLTEDVCNFYIDYILMPIIEDNELIFTERLTGSKFFEGTKFSQESKIKNIMTLLNLDPEKEAEFFDKFYDLITDLEWYLERKSINDPTLEKKNLDQILKEAESLYVESKGKF